MDILFISLLLCASISDIKKREIPPFIPICIGIISLFDLHIFGVLAAFPLFLCACFAPNKIGGGDVKLVAAVGLYIGLTNTMFALIIGLTIAVIHHIITKGRADKGIPLAPFMSIGFIIILIFGGS